MSLEAHFLEYPQRKHAMDHERYAWSNLFERKKWTLPNSAKLIVFITIPVEFFPLNPSGKPFKAPGSMVTQYPDFRHYTTRDYGNRVGIYRLLNTLEKYDLKANFAFNSEVAVRYPSLLNDVVLQGHEIVAHGVDMDTLHYGGMDHQREIEQVSECINTLKNSTGQQIKGWMSPAFNESFYTPDIVKENGCTYICDWSNDDMPYLMDTSQGSIVALPVSQEISDRQIIINYHQTEDSFIQQVKDQADVLLEEANEYGGRILSLTLTPYISGLPFRISAISDLFDYLNAKQTINLTGSEIVSLMDKQ